jgi:hypothetical protein
MRTKDDPSPFFRSWYPCARGPSDKVLRTTVLRLPDQSKTSARPRSSTEEYHSWTGCPVLRLRSGLLLMALSLDGSLSLDDSLSLYLSLYLSLPFYPSLPLSLSPFLLLSILMFFSFSPSRRLNGSRSRCFSVFSFSPCLFLSVHFTLTHVFPLLYASQCLEGLSI